MLAEELLADIELDRIAAHPALLKASRLARLTNDADASRWITCELNGYAADDESHALMRTMGRWKRTDDGTSYYAPLATISALVEAQQGGLNALTGMSFSGDMLIPVTNNHRNAIQQQVASIAQLSIVIGSVRTKVYDFATRTYNELLFSEAQSDLFQATQSKIDAELGSVGHALDKVESVVDRLRAGDPEAVSGAMNTVRRLVDAIADALFEPEDTPYPIDDSNTILVKRSHVLNRLQAFAHRAGAPDGQRSRLRRTLRDLYERASSGVHSDVTVEEARFIFLQTYIAIGELLSLRASRSDTDTKILDE